MRARRERSGQVSNMFSVAERERARARVLELAASDPRVVAGAVVGSLALSEGDRWSDLDLMFAVADDVPVTERRSERVDRGSCLGSGGVSAASGGAA